MDDQHFDRLVQRLVAPGYRRGFLWRLTTLPLLAPAIALLAPLFRAESEAARRHRTRRRHAAQRGQVQDEPKKHRKRKKKMVTTVPPAPPSPAPPSPPPTCAQSCGGC